MKRLFLLITIFSFLILPIVSFGAVSYSRTPSGNEITSPVNFSVNADDILDLCPNSTGLDEVWLIRASAEQNDYDSQQYSSTTLVVSTQVIIPVGEVIQAVYAQCIVSGGDGVNFETYNQNGIFTIIAGAVSNFISVPNTAGTDLFALAGGLVSDIWVLLAIAFGVPLAFYLINKAIDLMPEEKKNKAIMKKSKKIIRETEKLIK